MGSIAFVVRSLDLGGAQRQLVTLAIGLRQRGHEITVIPLYGGGALAAELSTGGVNVRTVGKRSRWDLIRPIWRLAETVRGLHPCVIHGYLPDGNLLALALGRMVGRGAKVVWGVRAADMDLSRYDWLARLTWRLAGWGARGADLIIANSRAGASHHQTAGYPPERIVVIPNGIDTARFRPAPELRAAIRRVWGFRPDATVIGLVARLDPIKDHQTFLAAAATAIKGRPALEFACVGGGPEDYRRMLMSEADRLGVGDRVRWVGATNDAPGVFNALDVLTSTSTSEGFSNVIAESMACGVRCVVTDVGDSAWVVGDTGLVVRPRDPAAVAAAWLTLLSQSVSMPAPRQRIESLFAVDRLVESTERVLAELAWRRG